MNQLIFSQDYRLDKKTVRSAIFKKHFTEHLVKTIIQAGLFLLMGIYFTLNLILTGDRMSIFLLVVCFAFAIMVIANPFLTANSEAKIFSQGVDFKFYLYKEGVKIARGETETELVFESISKALDTDDFIYIESKQRFFPIPKDVFDDLKRAGIKKVFSENLEERYKNRVKKTDF